MGGRGNVRGTDPGPSERRSESMASTRYQPLFFPVQTVKGKSYNPGVGQSDTCRVLEKPWFTETSFSEVRSGGARHSAVDIFAPLEARVVAPRAGRVLTTWRYEGQDRTGAGWSEKGGWYVRMRTEDGSTEYFAHMLRRPLVKSGDAVRAGQLLGFVGQTGNATHTCPHLHYGVRDRAGVAIDPTGALRALHDRGLWRHEGGSLLPMAIALGIGAAGLWWVLRR